MTVDITNIMDDGFRFLRYLTIREKKLRQRRLDAERLLAWKNRLDKEEEEVHRLEMEAAQKIVPKKETSGYRKPQ